MASPLRTLVLACLLCPLALAKPPAGPVIYDPDPAQPGAGKLERETWSKESPTASLWLTRVDEQTRKAFVKNRAGLEADPFLTSPARDTGGFIAFHVLIENRTESRLVFQPQWCRLQTSWKDFQAPLDLPTILSAYALADRQPPKGIERIRSAIIDGEVVLHPGERRDGLFIFHAFDPAAKRFQIDVQATLTNGDAFGFSAFYKKRKK